MHGNNGSKPAELVDSVEMIESSSTLGDLTRAEVDMQIATAKRFPRSVTRFIEEATSLVQLSEEIAGDCMYSLPRKQKDKETGRWIEKAITGPSARFGEIVASCWGNCKAGARVVNEERGFVVAQGAFYDLERNVAITYEVKRRITDSTGTRYGDDMIAITANAACSIALRNAILKGVPKAFWSPIYDASRKCAIGSAETLTSKRAKMVDYFKKMGVKESLVYAVVGAKGIEDIGLDDLATLRGIATAIKEGDTTIEQAFNPKPEKVAENQDVLTIDEPPADTFSASMERRIADIDSPDQSTDLACEIDEAVHGNVIDAKESKRLGKLLNEKVASLNETFELQG